MNSTPVVDRFIEGIGLRICFFEATDEPSLLYRCSVLGDEATLRLSGYLLLAAMFGVLATLEANRIGVFLVPPFAATLTILMLLSEAPVAQPYALIVGSVCGAAVGTGASFFGSGLGVAVLAMIAPFAPYQSDSRLPSESPWHPFPSRSTRVIGFLCLSCFLSPPQR
jgi:HPP family